MGGPDKPVRKLPQPTSRLAAAYADAPRDALYCPLAKERDSDLSVEVYRAWWLALAYEARWPIQADGCMS